MNDDVSGRKEKVGRTAFTCGRHPFVIFLPPKNAYTGEPRWASKVWHVQNNTFGLNPLLLEQIACVEGLPLLNIPFSLAVQVINEGAGLAFRL